MSFIFASICIYLLLSIVTVSGQNTPNLAINAEDGREVCRLLNVFRQENGLTTLQQSVSLSLTAEVHYMNLVENNHDFFNQDCNAHSWYPNATLGLTEFCCYPQQECMGNKAKLVTQTWLQPYPGLVIENVHYKSGSGSFATYLTPADALEAWKNSPGHRVAMLIGDLKACGAIVANEFTPGFFAQLRATSLLYMGRALDPNLVRPPDGVSPTPPPTNPTHFPTPVPTPQPTNNPTHFPTPVPTPQPTKLNPDNFPTPVPTAQPTKLNPDNLPTFPPETYYTTTSTPQTIWKDIVEVILIIIWIMIGAILLLLSLYAMYTFCLRKEELKDYSIPMHILENRVQLNEIDNDLTTITESEKHYFKLLKKITK